jgi:lysophospholipase L1-like esterase
VEPVPPLALNCPADISVPDVKSLQQMVEFSPPAHAGGLEPVMTTCAPASGSAFALGSTNVTCTATDAGTPARTAACGFKVTLVPYVSPTLGATRFMAFGDSITAGEINDDDTGARCTNRRALMTPQEFALFLKPEVIIPSQAYPNLVQGLLTARYINQTFTVINEGKSLDSTDKTERFSGVVQADRPQAVFFLEGVIDLTSDNAVPAMVANVDADIAEARNRGVTSFFLSTLTPVLNFSRGCFLSNADIRAANDAYRALAVRDNVVLVDSWAAFQGHESTYIGADGLHPSVAGQQVIARAFFDAVEAKLELPAAPAATPAARRPGSSLAGPQVQIRPKPDRQPIGIRHDK